ncbi:conserved hypothetical protein [Candidatus Nitrotoga sp. HW29]|uniref:class I SAM-dependent methyltransferase n=1 Tax=Candidatus Nitrotoga sp. HW29 TaxID=2886963 RepID=UPI001EF17658|nr:class I SAM-dependent methyltransferase [Candidatus Nitrotoga sp. HW29]CAH1906345.1 conserved hypothetical protein [Candidatus Nitrotoga sp. HW29]
MAKLEDRDYYSHVRQEIGQLLPGHVCRMLEIGCGRGDTAAWVKQSHNPSWVCGIELDPCAAVAAAQKLDHVITGNFEALDFPDDFHSFDLILCLDVLEHLVDPWQAVRRIHKLLAPGGVMVTSIPNIRYFKVVWSLLAKGQWNYEDDGILDRTHLRFFTRSSALELVQCSGLQLEVVSATGMEPGRKARYLNRLTLSLLKPFFEYQYVIRVRKFSL